LLGVLFVVFVLFLIFYAIYLEFFKKERPKDDSKKTIPISKPLVKSLTWGFLISFVLMMVINHFGEIYARMYVSPFGTTFMFGETYNVSLYIVRLIVYMSAIITDIGYFMLFWFIFSGIIFFFKKFKFSIQ